MKLYLDDNLAEKKLVALLGKAGHSVFRPSDHGRSGDSDANHLEFAIRNNWILLTRDKVDFRDLHQLVVTAGGSHPGILMIRFENDPTKDMKPKHVASAISKLIKSGVVCTNSLTVLNNWR